MQNKLYLFLMLISPPQCGTRNLRQDSHKSFYLFSVREISYFFIIFFLEMQACLAHSLRLLVCTNSVWLSAMNTSISLN